MNVCCAVLKIPTLYLILVTIFYALPLVIIPRDLKKSLSCDKPQLNF